VLDASVLAPIEMPPDRLGRTERAAVGERIGVVRRATRHGTVVIEKLVCLLECLAFGVGDDHVLVVHRLDPVGIAAGRRDEFLDPTKRLIVFLG
jgi:hypothetical protein